jgi:hypothetical protein
MRHVRSLLALACAGLGYWLVITLPAGAVTAAGWRHELLATGLGALCVLLAAGFARRPGLAERAAGADAALVLAAFVLPLPRLPVLFALAAAQLLLCAGALRAELSRRRDRLQTAAIIAGLIDLAAITPVFIACELGGALKPPL